MASNIALRSSRLLRSSLSTPLFRPATLRVTRSFFSSETSQQQQQQQAESQDQTTPQQQQQQQTQQKTQNGQPEMKSSIIGDSLLAKIKELEAKNSELQKVNADIQKAKKELEDKSLLHLANIDNIQKIAKRDVENAKKYGLFSFAKDLITTCDNLKVTLLNLTRVASDLTIGVTILQRALLSVPKEELEKGENVHLKGLFEGVSMTKEELFKTCAKYELKVPTYLSS